MAVPESLADDEQLDSAALNAAITQINEQFEGSFPHGKPIPYMGWFWRRVDFSEPSYSFGLAADGSDGRPWVAFMENNKWGYSTEKCEGSAWENIKRLLQIAAKERTLENVRAVWDAIQAVGENLRGSPSADEHGFDTTEWKRNG